MNNKQGRISIVFIILFIVIANIVAVVWFNNVVFRELEHSAKSSLDDMAGEQGRAISLIIHNKQDNVKGIVDVVRRMDEGGEVLYEALDSWEEEYEIETIIITDELGRGVTSTGENTDVSTEDYFKTTVQGSVEITDVYESQFSGNLVLAVTAPIYNEGIVEGVIVAEYNVYELAELLVGTTDSRGSAMIVNSQGNILLHTYPFPISLENFQSATFEDGASYEKILEDFANSQYGEVTFSIQGERKLGEYIPLGVDDWTLFFEISESALSDSGNAITTGMLIVNISLIIGFSILLFYILWIRRKSVKQIERIAYYDKLTGVSNLVKFKLDLAEIISRKDFDASKYILLKSDVENFKVVNEVYGREVGDRVICQIAKNVKNMAGEVFEIARTGSDEFIVLAEKAKVEEYFAKREQYDEELKFVVPEVKKHIFKYRYGRYFIEANETNVDDMINKVMIAHSYVRTKSEWTMWDYDEEFKHHMLRMSELTNKMEDALEQQEFKMFLQPKYKLATNKIVGAEALVRWFETDGTVIYPNEFISLFEKNEFITTLDEYIFESACAFIAKQREEGKEYVPISVNFSRRHLQNENFVSRLQEIAHKHNVETEYLEIELTETTVIEHADILHRVLDNLHEAGFRISIDDFGSGYSSLGMLKDYKFDVVKLDRSFFVAEEEGREVAKTVLTGIINLVTSLGSKVVAEGIEYEDQVEFLRTVDCHSVQGYYFAKPMAVKEFQELI